MSKQLKNIPVSVILGAMNAEPDAITYILTYFKNYILCLSTRTITDDYGKECLYLDEDMRTRLEAKLICSIINNFKIRINSWYKGSAPPFVFEDFIPYKRIISNALIWAKIPIVLWKLNNLFIWYFTTTPYFQWYAKTIYWASTVQ